MDPLTPAELADLRLLATGMTYRECARIRGISVETLKRQTSSIYSKLDVTGLVGAMHAMGWVNIPYEDRSTGHTSVLRSSTG